LGTLPPPLLHLRYRGGRGKLGNGQAGDVAGEHAAVIILIHDPAGIIFPFFQPFGALDQGR
jgi:hypothetical protein